MNGATCAHTNDIGLCTCWAIHTPMQVCSWFHRSTLQFRSESGPDSHILCDTGLIIAIIVVVCAIIVLVIAVVLLTLRKKKKKKKKKRQNEKQPPKPKSEKPENPVCDSALPIRSPLTTNTTNETDNTQQTTSFNADTEYSTPSHLSKVRPPAPKNADTTEPISLNMNTFHRIQHFSETLL